MSNLRNVIRWDRGIAPYSLAWDWQRQLVAQRKRENNSLPDVLMLLEHPPVYTLGQGSSIQFLKFDPQTSPYEIYRIERGGEVTYHCPGQLVGYPILNLRYYQQDLHWYLRALEEVLIRTIQTFNLPARRVPGMTGVWVDDIKVAAIGIKVSRWITMHGFALNVCPDLKGFDRIVPCGLVNRSVGSLQQFLPHIALAEVRALVADQFAEVFQVQFSDAVFPFDAKV